MADQSEESKRAMLRRLRKHREITRQANQKCPSMDQDTSETDEMIQQLEKELGEQEPPEDRPNAKPAIRRPPRANDQSH